MLTDKQRQELERKIQELNDPNSALRKRINEEIENARAKASQKD